VEAGDAGVIHSLLIVAGGRLVVEEYFHGWGPDDLHHLASVTKSVSSLLVGQAIDTGDIAGVDTPVLDFFPDLEAGDDPRWQDEKLRHVLGMCMGLDWDVADDGPHGTGPEFFQQVLNRSVAHDPGTDFEYRSANVNLLAGVLRQATGMHADRWAQERLFRPLGIENFDWSYLAVDGYRLMDGSLQLCPRDLAKLGMLLRDEGRWQGRPVVAPDWIRESTAPFMAADGPWRYGYLWWIGEYPTDSGPEPVVFARGRGSQFLVWMPVRDLIVVTTGGNEDNGKGMAVMRVLARHLFQG
jgi:CubicO group peptidase (beta-lactamase class C family)